MLKKISEEINNNISTKTTNNMGGRISNGCIKLNICSINQCGASNNRSLLNERLASAQILAFTESWHKNIRDLRKCIADKNKTVIQKPATKTNEKRYSGGIGFIVDQTINCEHEFVANNIAVLIINRLVIINTYLPYYDGVNSTNHTKSR